jgi:hypothetical protein
MATLAPWLSEHTAIATPGTSLYRKRHVATQCLFPKLSLDRPWHLASPGYRAHDPMTHPQDRLIEFGSGMSCFACLKQTRSPHQPRPCQVSSLKLPSSSAASLPAPAPMLLAQRHGVFASCTKEEARNVPPHCSCEASSSMCRPAATWPRSSSTHARYTSTLPIKLLLRKAITYE